MVVPECGADPECARLIGEAAEALGKVKEASGYKLGGLLRALSGEDEGAGDEAEE